MKNDAKGSNPAVTSLVTVKSPVHNSRLILIKRCFLQSRIDIKIIVWGWSFQWNLQKRIYKICWLNNRLCCYFYQSRFYGQTRFLVAISFCLTILILLSDPGVTISQTGDFVFVSSSRGIRVKFDDKSSVYLTLDENFKQIPIQGLCGDYNGATDGTSR